MDSRHFVFQTNSFKDLETARKQNINEIEGHSLALWLSSRLKESGFEASDIWAEDHGWDFSLAQGGSEYLCACSLADDEENPEEIQREGHVTLHKSRSLMDKLKGRNKLEPDDPVAAAIRAALAAHTDVQMVDED